MKNLRKIILLALGITCAMILAGCSGSDEQEADADLPADVTDIDYIVPDDYVDSFESGDAVFYLTHDWYYEEDSGNNGGNTLHFVYFDSEKPDDLKDFMSVNYLEDYDAQPDAERTTDELYGPVVDTFKNAYKGIKDLKTTEITRDGNPAYYVTFSSTDGGTMLIDIYLFKANDNDLIAAYYFRDEKNVDENHDRDFRQFVRSIKTAYNEEEPSAEVPEVVEDDDDDYDADDDDDDDADSTPSTPFTNKYGTPTTICAHPGCNNYIASSGDTNCCTEHSNRCMECGKYIDEDAMICMDCVEESLSNN